MVILTCVVLAYVSAASAAASAHSASAAHDARAAPELNTFGVDESGGDSLKYGLLSVGTIRGGLELEQ